MGEYNEPDDIKYNINVKVSSKNKTITFTDNGLGMTAEEVNEYINQIAFPEQRPSLKNIRTRLMKTRL